ncbi:cytochrome c551 [Calidifontibacillus oryziterrae]|uniref:cytochrome c551 n=1 Tax=Calidifontibacillus oryziterrae TaxID=1191699 RepID=UPI0003163329|nr:cytochrome c [Calidifontibacillus oryziterrae]
MNKKLLALFMGSALVLGACGGGGDTAEQPAPADGGDQAAQTESAGAAEGLYAQNCSTCHGQNLEGLGDSFPALANIGSKLDAAGIENVILNGQGAMPAGLISGDDAKVVAEWLSTKK